MDTKREGRYHEVARDIERRILSGEYKPGTKIPSENELKVEYGLSRQTIRKALEILLKKNIVYSVRGSGTYVAGKEEKPSPGGNTIALILTYVDGYIFPHLIQNIQSVLFEHGYAVQIHFTSNRIDLERVILKGILERNEVVGVIAEATKSGIPNPDIDLYKAIMKRGIPLLFINGFYSDLDAPHVSMDDVKAGKRAADYLIENGHRKIAGIFKLDDIQGRQRFEGYIQSLKENDIATSGKRVIWYDTEDLEHLDFLAEKIKSRIKDCSALIIYNDQLAYNLIPMIESWEIAVPNDLSIVSIDNSDLAVMGDVQLTSVAYPIDKLGVIAAENMLKMLNNPQFNGNYAFDEPIVVRDSVLPI